MHNDLLNGHVVMIQKHATINSLKDNEDSCGQNQLLYSIVYGLLGCHGLCMSFRGVSHTEKFFLSFLITLITHQLLDFSRYLVGLMKTKRTLRCLSANKILM